MNKSSSTQDPQPVTKEMVISELFSNYPEKGQKFATLMAQAGLHCVGCGAATWETLEAGMLGHGKSYEEIDRLILELNQVVMHELKFDEITLTAKAASQFLTILKKEDKEGWGLRFADKAGGCNGFEYLLDFCKEANEDDCVFDQHGVSIFVKETSLKRLLGSEIDYQEGLYGAGFKVTNPNAKSACNCGTSHNY
jgi:iron-sulfur cluster assembly protein